MVNGNTRAPAGTPEWPMRRRVPGAAAEAAGGREPAPAAAAAPTASRSPATDRRSGAPSRSGAPEPEPVNGSAADVRAPIDDPAYSRASQLLQNGQTWNAFVPYPREAPAAETDAAPKAPPVNERTDRPTVPANLRQRVPGAQLPTRGSVRRTPAPPGPADPAGARALIEQFEAGVQHAERQVAAVDPVPTSPAPAGAPNGGLRQRRPGATLDSTATAVERPNEEPLDADEARELVQQFESGVAQAIRQISAGIRDEEGSTR